MSAWSDKVLAAEAKKAGSANEATRRIPRPPSRTGGLACIHCRSEKLCRRNRYVTLLTHRLTDTPTDNYFITCKLAYNAYAVYSGHKMTSALTMRPLNFRTLLQTVSYDVSIYPRHLSVLTPVMFHPRFRDDIQTTAAVFYLTSSGRSARSSLYSL